MIIPLGERYQQMLYLFRKEQGELVQEALLPTLFVPMTGTAEERRVVLPDPSHPAIYNGGFEEASEGEEIKPIGWHYIRQARVTQEQGATEGKACLEFTNAELGQTEPRTASLPHRRTRSSRDRDLARRQRQRGPAFCPPGGSRRCWQSPFTMNAGRLSPNAAWGPGKARLRGRPSEKKLTSPFAPRSHRPHRHVRRQRRSLL